MSCPSSVLHEAEEIAELAGLYARARTQIREIADTCPDELVLPLLRAVGAVLAATCPGPDCRGSQQGGAKTEKGKVL